MASCTFVAVTSLLVASMSLAIDQSRRGRWEVGLAIATFAGLLLAGAYYLLLVASPTIAPLLAKPLQAPVASASSMNTLYIPKIGLTLPFSDGDNTVLNKGAWHRWPERGNPERGGNFILAGHRFSMGLTPAETVKKSPFYHLDKIVEGDIIYIDYVSKRYEYTVKKHFTVKPSQSEIEAPSTKPKLTLYSCTLAGEADGREVIEATLRS